MTSLNLDPTLLLLLIASLFILTFGVLSLLRREGLSVQFALEAVGVTALLVGGARLLGLSLSPLLFVVLLYLITMRSRLAVDIANLLAQRGNYGPAFGLYRLALACWPDAAARLVVLTNRGAAELRSGQLEAAVRTLEGVLEEAQRPHLGRHSEAVCRYNLGLAYSRRGEIAKATRQFNEVIDLMPGSVYARAAAAALARQRKQKE